MGFNSGFKGLMLVTGILYQISYHLSWYLYNRWLFNNFLTDVMQITNNFCLSDNKNCTMRDFRLPPRSRWKLRSSGSLRSE